MIWSVITRFMKSEKTAELLTTTVFQRLFVEGAAKAGLANADTIALLAYKVVIESIGPRKFRHEFARTRKL